VYHFYLFKTKMTDWGKTNVTETGRLEWDHVTLPILTCSDSHFRGGNKEERERAKDFIAVMEANLHSHPGFLNAKPGGAGRNLEITQECLDDTEILHENSEAFQDIANSIAETVNFDCKLRTGQQEISNDCTARFPQSLVDEIIDVCEDEGGQPVSLPDATIFCDATYEGVVNVTTSTRPWKKVKFSVASENAVECVALSCDEDAEDWFEIYEPAMAELKQEMQEDIGMDYVVNCWVEDGGGGLSGGAIAGIVIGSVFGAALLLAIGA
jgi:hypothetical protein